jgi:hypothetical protein
MIAVANAARFIIRGQERREPELPPSIPRKAKDPAIVVNESLPGLCINMAMVNWSAPELLPATTMLNKHFIPAAIPSRRARFPAGSKSYKPLK